MGGAMYGVADVLERNREVLADRSANTWQLRTLHAIRKCRTAALGGHIDKCDNPKCNRLHLSYNSCRNRHCPKCQGHKREQWIRAREKISPAAIAVAFPGRPVTNRAVSDL